MTRSVLLVDDEPGIRAALTANFAREGWQVIAASGVREAEYRLAQAEFDLVVSDVRLPDGSGASLLRIAQTTPILLLTAYGAVPEAVEAIRNGARDYLIKPIAWQQLREAAARCVEAPALIQFSPERGVPEPLPSRDSLQIREVERRHFARTLALARGNRTHAAEMLGISVRTIRNKIREYGLPARTYPSGSTTSGANA